MLVDVFMYTHTHTHTHIITHREQAASPLSGYLSDISGRIFSELLTGKMNLLLFIVYLDDLSRIIFLGTTAMCQHPAPENEHPLGLVEGR